MGIKNFGTLLKKATSGVTTTNYSAFSGQRVAIDASIFCYRFSHNSQSKRPNSHIDGFYQLFMRFLKFKITPILVFDGKTPHEKQHTLECRAKHKQKNLDKVEKLQDELKTMIGAEQVVPITQLEKVVTQYKGTALEGTISDKIAEIKKANKNIIQFQPSIYDDIRYLCELMNVPVLRARGEADALCAKLYETGQVQAIMSEDSDILLHKGGRLIRKFGWTNEVELLELDKILQSLGINYEQFVDLAILCGTDYTASTIGGFGPINALEYISQGMNIEQILKHIQETHDVRYHIPPAESFTYQEARNLINTARHLEEDIQLNSFVLKELKFEPLAQLMTEKCHYRYLTIQKHYDQLKEIYVVPAPLLQLRPKLRIELKLKPHPQ